MGRTCSSGFPEQHLLSTRRRSVSSAGGHFRRVGRSCPSRGREQHLLPVRAVRRLVPRGDAFARIPKRRHQEVRVAFRRALSTSAAHRRPPPARRSPLRRRRGPPCRSRHRATPRAGSRGPAPRCAVRRRRAPRSRRRPARHRGQGPRRAARHARRLAVLPRDGSGPVGSSRAVVGPRRQRTTPRHLDRGAWPATAWCRHASGRGGRLPGRPDGPSCRTRSVRPAPRCRGSTVCRSTSR